VEPALCGAFVLEQGSSWTKWRQPYSFPKDLRSFETATSVGVSQSSQYCRGLPRLSSLVNSPSKADCILRNRHVAHHVSFFSLAASIFIKFRRQI
jgi:uncharacterized protein YfaQ (DUF2300 family)